VQKFSNLPSEQNGDALDMWRRYEENWRQAAKEVGENLCRIKEVPWRFLTPF
jgi:hypothetical protein